MTDHHICLIYAPNFHNHIFASSSFFNMEFLLLFHNIHLKKLCTHFKIHLKSDFFNRHFSGEISSFCEVHSVVFFSFLLWFTWVLIIASLLDYTFLMDQGGISIIFVSLSVTRMPCELNKSDRKK